MLKLDDAHDNKTIGIRHRKLSKAEFASLIQRQIDRCMKNDAGLGALTIIFSTMDFMSGDGKVSDWIKLYMPPMENDLITVKSEDFWGSRCGLLYGMDVHSKNRNKFGGDYRPIMFHQGIDDSTRIFMSSVWGDKDIVVEQGTHILPLIEFVKAFISGMWRWADGSDECPPFVFPILGKETIPKEVNDQSLEKDREQMANGGAGIVLGNLENISYRDVWFLFYRPQINLLMSGSIDNHVAALMLLWPCMERVFTLKHPEFDPAHPQGSRTGVSDKVLRWFLIDQDRRNLDDDQLEAAISVLHKQLVNGLKHDSFVRPGVLFEDRVPIMTSIPDPGANSPLPVIVESYRPPLELEDDHVIIGTTLFWRMIQERIDRFYLEEYDGWIPTDSQDDAVLDETNDNI